MNDRNFRAANGRRLLVVAFGLTVGLVGSASAQEAPFLTLNGFSETITVRDFNSGANDDTTFNPTGGSAPTQTTAGGISSYQYPGAIVNDPKLLFDDGGGTYNQLRYNWVRARYRQSAASGISVWERVEAGGQAATLGAATVNFAEGTGDPSNPGPTGAGYRLDPFANAPLNGVFEIDYLVSDRMRTFGLGEWDKAGDPNGWTTSNITGPTIAGSQLTGTSNSTSPQLDSPQFNANQHGLVEVRMQRNGTGTAGLSWAQAGAFDGTQRFEFTPVDTGSNTYMIDLSKQPSWTGADMQLRLEPTNESGQSFAVDYVRARAVPVSQWDPNKATAGTGGDGVWDINPANNVWRGEQGTTLGGAQSTNGWLQTTYDDAVFDGVAGTVVIGGGPPQVNDISFRTDGYVVEGVNPTARLKLVGARPQIEVTTGTTTIDVPLIGNQGLEKTGAGTLTLNGVNTYTGTTRVSEGVLELGVGATTFDIGVANASFEAPGLAANSFIRYDTMSATQKTDFAWTAVNNPALFRNGSAWGYDSVPDGVQGVSLQRDGGVSQSITFSEAGLYTVSWMAADRPNVLYPDNTLEVFFDGQSLGTYTPPTADGDYDWDPYSANIVVPAPGAYELTFQGNPPASGDRSLAIDDVAITGSRSQIQTDLIIGDGVGVDTLRLLNAERIADSAIVTIDGTSAGNNGVFELNGFSETVGGIASTGSAAVIENGGANSAILTVNNTADHSYAGILRDGGAGALNLIKEGNGTLTMTGGNTFSGGLLVNGGTLINNGSMPNAPVTVAAVATLGGSGTYGDLSISGTISPGNSVGTMFAGDTTWSDGSSFLFEIDNATGVAGGPGGWDLLNLGGDTLTLSGLTAGGFEIDVDTLLSGGGTVSGDMDNFVDADVYDWEFVRAGSIVDFDAGDFTFDVTGFTNAYDPAGVFSISQQGSSLYVTYTSPFTSVPEPGTWALFGLLLIGGICYQRKRQARSAIANGARG